MKLLRLLCPLVFLGTVAVAQRNPVPVPLINQPLVPMTVKPGG